jgi:hypothetical protein
MEHQFQVKFADEDFDYERRKGKQEAWVYGKGWSWTSQNFTWACHALPFYALQAGHPWNGLAPFSGVAHLQGRWPAAVFYPFVHPTPYAYEGEIMSTKVFGSMLFVVYSQLVSRTPFKSS